MSNPTAVPGSVLTERKSTKSQVIQEPTLKEQFALNEITSKGDGSASADEREKGSIRHEKAVGMDEALVDDPAIYTVTVRACIVGTCVAVFGASVAQVE